MPLAFGGDDRCGSSSSQAADVTADFSAVDAGHNPVEDGYRRGILPPERSPCRGAVAGDSYLMPHLTSVFSIARREIASSSAISIFIGP